MNVPLLERGTHVLNYRSTTLIKIPYKLCASSLIRRRNFLQNLRTTIARSSQAIFALPPLPIEQRKNSRSVPRELTNNAKQTNKKRSAVRFNFRYCV
jgi:hypothetical protein